MASNYPGSLDSFDTIASDKKTSDSVGGRTHRQMHNDLGDAIEAVQTELGTTPSGSEATVVARLDKIEDGTRLGTNSVGATQLADNAVDTAAIQDGAVTSAKIADGTIVAGDVAASTFAAFGTVGNLLTANQASPTTPGGFGVAAGTESSAGVYTVAGAPDMTVYLDTPTVTAGDTYTFYVDATATGADGTPYLLWFTAANTLIGSAISGTAIIAGTRAVRTIVSVAPATAAYAQIQPAYMDGDPGDSLTIHRAGFWKGAGGQWAMPGVPIPGQGAIKANDALELPGGTTAPNGNVAAPTGSTYLQTSGAATKTGMLSWRKETGTGNTGWAAEGALADTGWRNVSADLLNSYTGAAQIRRVGALVELRLMSVTGATATDVYTLPMGFRTGSEETRLIVQRVDSGSVYTARAYMADASGTTVSLDALAGTPAKAAGDSWNLNHSWFTPDAWPASLPGSAV